MERHNEHTIALLCVGGHSEHTIALLCVGGHSEHIIALLCKNSFFFTVSCLEVLYILTI